MLDMFVPVVDEVERMIGIIDSDNNGWSLPRSDADARLLETSDLVNIRNLISLVIDDD